MAHVGAWVELKIEASTSHRGPGPISLGIWKT